MVVWGKVRVRLEGVCHKEREKGKRENSPLLVFISPDPRSVYSLKGVSAWETGEGFTCPGDQLTVMPQPSPSFRDPRAPEELSLQPQGQERRIYSGEAGQASIPVSVQ